MPRNSNKPGLASVEEALEAFLAHVRPVSRSYKGELDFLDNRILSADVIAPQDYPHYDRCYMDGYAVRSEDTSGGAALLRPCKEGTVGPGQCQWVHTGSALPPGADAVVRVEDTKEEADGIRVAIEARPGDYFTPRGAIIRQGDLVFPAGLQLKPTNIALLATLGMTFAEVYEKPRVLIIPTGDELVERGHKAGSGTINESNGLMCQLLVRRYGGKPSVWDIVPDEAEKLTEAIRTGLGYDLIVTTGGTSVGVRDLLPQVVASMGKVVVHGVGIRPGRPVGMGYVEDGDKRTPIVFLPGFPDACAVGAILFVNHAVRKLGRYPPSRYASATAVLSGEGPVPRASRSFVKVRVHADRATPVGTVGPTPCDGEYAYMIVPEKDERFKDGQPVDLLFLE
ncbi:MAG TPA: molybdopterin molybdotransferase MoeA [Methanocella sp.]|jgi:molybdopterin molybdotransferase